MEGLMMFGKWSMDDVQVTDVGLSNYICLKGSLTLHSHGVQGQKQFGKMTVNIAERLANSLMRSSSGRKVSGKTIRHKFGCGEKTAALNTVRDAFMMVEERTKENPVQVLVKAIQNAAPREETTRLKFGGMTRHIPVDVSPQRRIDVALRNIAISTLGKGFKNVKSRAQVLADEIVAAATNDANSQSIAKRIEGERVAKGAR